MTRRRESALLVSGNVGVHLLGGLREPRVQVHDRGLRVSGGSAAALLVEATDFSDQE